MQDIKKPKYRLHTTASIHLTDEGLSVKSKWGFGISLSNENPNKMSKWLDVEIGEDTASFLTSRLMDLLAISNTMDNGFISSMQYNGKDTTSLGERKINFTCEAADKLLRMYCATGEDEPYFCDADNHLLGWELVVRENVPMLSLRTVETIARPDPFAAVVTTGNTLGQIEYMLDNYKFQALKDISKTHLKSW